MGVKSNGGQSRKAIPREYFYLNEIVNISTTCKRLSLSARPRWPNAQEGGLEWVVLLQTYNVKLETPRGDAIRR